METLLRWIVAPLEPEASLYFCSRFARDPDIETYLLLSVHQRDVAEFRHSASVRPAQHHADLAETRCVPADTGKSDAAVGGHAGWHGHTGSAFGERRRSQLHGLNDKHIERRINGSDRRLDAKGYIARSRRVGDT